MSLASGTFTVNDGTRLHFEETGNREGMPIVFLHAFPMNHKMWEPQIRALEKDFRVIAPDLRGLGGSELGASPFTMEVLVDDLIELLDHLHVKKAVVCGLSMGGYVALRALERHPERFKGVVLADTNTAADTNESKIKRTQALKAVQTKGLSAFAEEFLKHALSAHTRETKPEVVARLKNIIESNNPAGVLHAIIALISRTDTTASLKAIKVPTLIAVGEEDTVTSVSLAEGMHKQIEGSKLAVLKKAGHFSNIENSEEFNRAFVAYLDSLVKQATK